MTLSPDDVIRLRELPAIAELKEERSIQDNNLPEAEGECVLVGYELDEKKPKGSPQRYPPDEPI
jgi:hypothetical protein